MSRLDENEDPDVLGNPRDCAEPRLCDGEDLDSLGDDVEDANGTVVADEADKDVEARPVTAAKPIVCPGLCDDVFYRPQLHVTIRHGYF